MSIGFDTNQGQNLDQLGYFGEISPLNAPGDSMSIGFDTKQGQNSTNWGILEK